MLHVIVLSLESPSVWNIPQSLFGSRDLDSFEEAGQALWGMSLSLGLSDVSSQLGSDHAS